MNYLAHLYLSQNNGLSKAGNLMADFLKHVDLEVQPKGVLQGIKNHQATDKFTDNHQVVLDLIPRFDPRFRRFVPIILDVTYDHMLAKSWSTYHDEELKTFTAHCYSQLAEVEQYMPEVMKRRLQGIAKNDWLAGYADIGAVEKTLISISSRIRFENHLDQAFDEVLNQYDLIEESFHRFFPELCSYIKTQDIESAATL